MRCSNTKPDRRNSVCEKSCETLIYFFENWYIFCDSLAFLRQKRSLVIPLIDARINPCASMEVSNLKAVGSYSIQKSDKKHVTDEDEGKFN